MKARPFRILGLAALTAACVAPPAHALPTMIRLGYVNCAACHIAPQGGGLLNLYGKGIDEAQSLRAGEYVPSTNPIIRALSWGGRISQDVRFVGQETIAGSTGGPVLGTLRNRFMYRNNTELGRGFRVSGVVVGETRSAPRPNLTYDPGVRSAQVYVTQAMVSYRKGNRFEISAGRDALPNGLNLPDLGMYIRARDQYGFYDSPTQVKAFWWGDRYTVSPYVFAPGGNERAGFHESGGGAMAEVDVLGNHRTVVGINGLHGVSHYLDRTMIGPYARLGFGRWGIFAEHDVTDRTLKRGVAPVSFRQHATFAQVFIAAREWLVPAAGFERLTVAAPYRERLWAPRFDLSCRLSSNFSLGVTSRYQRNAISGKSAPSVAIQLAMKTVY